MYNPRNKHKRNQSIKQLTNITHSSFHLIHDTKTILYTRSRTDYFNNDFLQSISKKGRYFGLELHIQSLLLTIIWGEI